MTKLRVSILSVLLCSISIALFCYYLATNPISLGDWKLFSQNIILQIMGSLVLGLTVVIIGILFEQKWMDELHKIKLEKDMNLLKLLVQKVFKRGKSKWNFKNGTPSFYFDDSWVNALYDLLTYNERKWESTLLDYDNSVKQSDLFVSKLLEFLSVIENAMIEAEKLDTKLLHSLIAPDVAAKKQSGYPADRMEADKEADFQFLVFRGAWAVVDSTSMLLGIALVSANQITFHKVESTMENAKQKSEQDEELRSLIGEVNKYQKELIQLTKEVKTISN